MEFHCRSAFWLLSEGHQWSHKNHSGSLSVRLSGSGGIGLLFCKEVPWQIIPTNHPNILRSQTFKKSRSGPFVRNEKGHQLWPNVSYIIIYKYQFVLLYRWTMMNQLFWESHGTLWLQGPQITPITGPRLGSLRNAWKYFATRQGEKFTKVPFFGPALPVWFEVMSGVFVVAGYCEDRMIIYIYNIWFID